MAGPRSAEQRKADALAKLNATDSDAWVASAPVSGSPHLVPLSFAWDGEHVILATEARSATARNIVDAGCARLALGGTRDVVMIDALLVASTPVSDAALEVADRYGTQADWDPRTARGSFVYLLLRPDRIQVWQEVDEIAGRTVMRDGTWSV